MLLSGWRIGLLTLVKWTDFRWPEEEEEQDVVEENGNQVEIQGEIIMLDD